MHCHCLAESFYPTEEIPFVYMDVVLINKVAALIVPHVEGYVVGEGMD